MNTAIIYGTKYGSTHKCANTLANEMEADTKVKEPAADLA